MIYWQLFVAFFKIGLFGFGGGYAMLSLLQAEIVTHHQWITTTEFADIVAISQMTPGPISINSATYIGYTTTGSAWGSAIATIALCLPSLILMIAASYFYVRLRNNLYVSQIIRSLRPVVIGMILAAALMLFNKENFIDYRSYFIFAIALIATLRKANPLLVISGAGIAGYILF